MNAQPRHNPYTGVNAHLQSLLQTPGTARQPSLHLAFHQAHVTHIADFLNRQLPENYIAVTEQSLQVLGFEPGKKALVKRPVPDVTVFQETPSKRAETQAAAMARPTWQVAVVQAMIEPDEEAFSAVVIREVVEQAALGRVVARLELLSPSNKPGGADYSTYRAKRNDALRSGIPLVEIDYLHESRSPIPGLPLYPHDDGSHPYAIAISDPRPTLYEGQTRVYGFDVDQSVPLINIPLAEEEILPFNLGEVYDYTFEIGRWYKTIDYSILPARFETYRADDQKRIRERMAAIAASPA